MDLQLERKHPVTHLTVEKNNQETSQVLLGHAKAFFEVLLGIPAYREKRLSNIWNQISHYIPAALEAKCIVRVEGRREKCDLRMSYPVLVIKNSHIWFVPIVLVCTARVNHTEEPPATDNHRYYVTSQLQWCIFQIFVSAHQMAQMFLYLLYSTNIFHSLWKSTFKPFFFFPL